MLELSTVACEAAVQTPEVAARNVLEREVGLSLDLPVAKDVDHVRMRDVTGEPGLFGEHLLRVGLIGDVRKHSFQDHDARLARRPRLEGTKDFRHPANCNTVDQSVVAQRGIRRWRRRR